MYIGSSSAPDDKRGLYGFDDLSLSKVFASFMKANILFVGLTFTQVNVELLACAGLALLVNLVGATFEALVIHREPLRRMARRWWNRIVMTPLIE